MMMISSKGNKNKKSEFMLVTGCLHEGFEFEAYKKCVQNSVVLKLWFEV